MLAMVLKWVKAVVWQLLDSREAGCEMNTMRLMQQCRIMAKSGLAHRRVNAWGGMTS